MSSGYIRLTCSIFFRTFAAVSTVFASDCFTIVSATLLSPIRRVYARRSRLASRMVAMSESRTCCPPAVGIGRRRSVSRLLMVPMLRMVYSVAPCFAIPAGRFRFSSTMRRETVDMLIPIARSFAGSTSMIMARSAPPLTFADATPSALCKIGATLSTRSALSFAGFSMPETPKIRMGSWLGFSRKTAGGCNVGSTGKRPRARSTSWRTSTAANEMSVP